MTKVEDTIIPPWLANPELAAPCPCGRPMHGDFIALEGKTGMVLLVHPECAMFMTDDDDD